MPAYALGRERTPGAPLLGAVAEHVTSGATGAPPAISPVTPGSVAQRQEAVQARQERDAASGDAVGSRGPGAPLSPAIRSQIEPRLGVDLGAGDRDCPSNGMKGGIRPAGSPADRRR